MLPIPRCSFYSPTTHVGRSKSLMIGETSPFTLIIPLDVFAISDRRSPSVEIAGAFFASSHHPHHPLI